MKSIFSAKQLAQKDFESFKKENLKEARHPTCSFTKAFKLLSVVGPLVSYRDTEDSYCRSSSGDWQWPHPSYQINYHVIDLNDPSKGVVLTDLFPENDVLRGLLSDPIVKRALKASGSRYSPKTVADLLRFFEDEGLSLEVSAGTRQAPKGCTFTFPENALEQFAFHHVQDGEVAVRISLQPDVGACRTAHAELGLLLSVPRQLASPLALAQTTKEGFLGKDARKIASTQSTAFSFGIGEHAKRHK